MAICQTLTKSLAQWGCYAMSNTRNYEKTTALIINKQIERKGYFRLSDVVNEYHPKFVNGLKKVCKAMVASGKLIYDAQSKQYKKPCQN